ncbi:MAG TPA: sensor histidine kinase [Candidatus Dormibacteraeota bacterium]|nr:sensor histidine kinase [Candidatus Dormibacteraeota bacterium]
MLRSVYRSLEDVAASGKPPDDGAEQLRSASRQVFQIIEEERMRIARDMHDGPAQSMANLVLQAEILERLISRDPQLVVNELADFKDSVRGVLDETRRLIFDLRPMTLDDLGLVPTLRKFVKEFGERAGINAVLRVTGQEARLPGSLEATVFRIVQEALNNARRHGAPSAVEVNTKFQPHNLEVSVRDNGIGVDVPAMQATLDTTRHFGLISMRERAELEKGTFQLISSPGEGAEVLISFPLPG